MFVGFAVHACLLVPLAPHSLTHLLVGASCTASLTCRRCSLGHCWRRSGNMCISFSAQVARGNGQLWEEEGVCFVCAFCALCRWNDEQPSAHG